MATKLVFRSIEHYQRWKQQQAEKAYFRRINEDLKNTKL